MGFVIGIDIGQIRDPTAIAVAETEKRRIDRHLETHFIIRHLERIPLGTPYPEVAGRIGKLIGNLAARTRGCPLVYLDATGVGKPIVDLLRIDASAVCSIVAVYFIHSDRRLEERTAGYLRVKLGKANLVSRLQALMQAGRIHLPRTREAQALARELLDYEIRVDENATDRYGAFRVGTHDDLATALGLAVQTDEPVGSTR